MKNESKKYIMSVLLLVVLTLFALWFTLKDDHGQAIQIIQSLSFFTILCIGGCCFLYYFFIAASLYVITKEKYPQYKFREALGNAFIGGFFSGITPSASGGQVGQIYVFNRHGVNPSDSAGILWLDFVMYQVVLIFYTLVLLFLRFTKFSAHYPALFTMIFIGFMLNGLVLLMLFAMAFFQVNSKTYVFMLFDYLENCIL